MAENTETPEEKESYVSDQLALKVWSVLARDLHDGGSIVLLEKAWDSKNEEFVMVPSYADQDPEAIRPDVWMCWRHELKPPKAGHTRIYDFARVVDAISIGSAEAIARIEPEQGLTRVEATRRFEQGEPGLVALVLRVYHLPRTYKINDFANSEGEGLFVPLPFDVAIEDLSPALDDEDFERRHAAVKAALGS